MECFGGEVIATRMGVTRMRTGIEEKKKQTGTYVISGRWVIL
jgi:hypothetical protein